VNCPRTFRRRWGEDGGIKTLGCVGTDGTSLPRTGLVASRTRRRDRSRRGHGTFADGTAGGAGDVISLDNRTIVVVNPRGGPRSKRIVPGLRFKIADGEMNDVVGRLVGRVRETRA